MIRLIEYNRLIQSHADSNSNNPNITINLDTDNLRGTVKTKDNSNSTSIEKQLFLLSSKKNDKKLSIREVILETNLQLDDIEKCLEKLESKNLVRKVVSQKGEVLYDFS